MFGRLDLLVLVFGLGMLGVGVVDDHGEATSARMLTVTDTSVENVTDACCCCCVRPTPGLLFADVVYAVVAVAVAVCNMLL